MVQLCLCHQFCKRCVDVNSMRCTSCSVVTEMLCEGVFKVSLCLFLSPGRHYCWELWARWTHQEPQRERYRWVAKQQIVFSSLSSIHLSSIVPPATQDGSLNPPQDAFQIPPWFDPTEWPPIIIPSVGLSELCQEDKSLCLQRDERGLVRPGDDQYLQHWVLWSSGNWLAGV